MHSWHIDIFVAQTKFSISRGIWQDKIIINAVSGCSTQIKLRRGACQLNGYFVLSHVVERYQFSASRLKRQSNFQLWPSKPMWHLHGRTVRRYKRHITLSLRFKIWAVACLFCIVMVGLQTFFSSGMDINCYYSLQKFFSCGRTPNGWSID